MGLVNTYHDSEVDMKQKTDDERLTYTIEECARLLGIGRNMAYERAKTGEIPVLKIGKRFLVPKRALDKLLEEGKPVASGGP
jgi:excisionase family DNA binding protein